MYDEELEKLYEKYKDVKISRFKKMVKEGIINNTQKSYLIARKRGIRNFREYSIARRDRKELGFHGINDYIEHLNRMENDRNYLYDYYINCLIEQMENELEYLKKYGRNYKRYKSINDSESERRGNLYENV